MVRRNPEGFYVYAYYEPGCEFPFYIGKGKNDRYRAHTKQSSLALRTRMSNKLKSLLSRGIQPVIRIVAQSLTESAAFALEKRLIWVLGRRSCHRSGCLLNLTDGGEGPSGSTHSAATREKMRAWHIGRPRSQETKAKLRIANLGKRATEETRRKMAEASRMSAKVKAAHVAKSKPIVAVDDKGNVLFEFVGGCEAERQGFNRSCICKSLRTGNPYRGYIWKYKEASHAA